ncbi:MAG: hypothetical protein RIR00_929 [Pseudomonadota bacterium]
MAKSIQDLFNHLSDGVLVVSNTGMVRFANRTAMDTLKAQAGRNLPQAQLLKPVLAAAGGYQRLPHQFQIALGDGQDGASTLQVLLDHSPLGSDGFMLVLRNRSAEERFNTVVNNFAELLRNALRVPLDSFAERLEALTHELGGLPVTGGADDASALIDEGRELVNRVMQLATFSAVFAHAPVCEANRIVIADLMQGLLKRVEASVLRNKLELRIHGDDASLPVIYGSERWLVEALHGYLEYITSHIPTASVIDIRLQGFGNFVLIVISNSGRVMNPQKMKHARPLAELNDAKAGIALGLPLCQRIVELHKGNLKMEEEDGAVLRFEIELPAGAPATGEQFSLSADQARRYAEDLSRMMQTRLARNAAAAGNPNAALRVV